MKKWILTIFFLFIMYSIYYDVTYGTVSTATEKVDIVAPQAQQDETFVLIEIQPGDTVLSILEEIQQGPIPVPISQAISDFKALNQLEPIHIQPQKTYKFPIYSVGDRPS